MNEKKIEKTANNNQKEIDQKEIDQKEIDQKFMNSIEFFRFEFNLKPHRIEDCELRELLRQKWEQNKRVNPLTGRKIQDNGRVWKQFNALCIT
jgi:hypothetical protein